MIEKDVRVKVNMEVDLGNIRVSEDHETLDVEQAVDAINAYIADGGDYEFTWAVIEDD